MTDKQPEALRLADDLYVSVRFYPQEGPDEPGGYESEFDMVLDQAAAELRRLHKVNAELVEAVKAALSDDQPYIERCKAALVKATGENNG
jgi:hypothetical protein